MNFKSTWTTFNIFLWSSQAQDSSGWRAKCRQALLIATQDKLPNRPGRSFEREAYARRPKSTPFKKRKPKTPEPKPDSSSKCHWALAVIIHGPFVTRCVSEGFVRVRPRSRFEAVILCGIGFQPVVFFGEFDRLEAYPTEKITASSGYKAARCFLNESSMNNHG